MAWAGFNNDKLIYVTINSMPIKARQNIGKLLLGRIQWQHKTPVGFQRNPAFQWYYHASASWESMTFEEIKYQIIRKLAKKTNKIEDIDN